MVLLKSDERLYILTNTSPENFVCFTRGGHSSEAAAIRMAKKRRKEYPDRDIYVVYQAANRLFEAIWYVGYIDTLPPQ